MERRRLSQVKKAQEEDHPKTLQEEMRHLERMVGPIRNSAGFVPTSRLGFT